uniref:BACK domain-containing protein n=1 Tax=Glossina pallidipes TaxID=7398 RepID=A0A1A9ZW96_GLOPL
MEKETNFVNKHFPFNLCLCVTHKRIVNLPYSYIKISSNQQQQQHQRQQHKNQYQLKHQHQQHSKNSLKSSPVCLNISAAAVSLSHPSHLRLSALATQTTSPSPSLAPATPSLPLPVQNLPALVNFGNQSTTVTPSLQNNDNMTDNIQNLIKDEQRKTSMRFVESAYKASINWIKHGLEERKVHLRELMSHIHLPCVSTEFLRNHVAGEPMVIEDQKCSKSLIEALSERCSPERRSTESCATEREMFYVVGGRSTGCVEKYDSARNRWERCSSTPAHNQLCTRAALAEHSIYGFTNSSCFRFDPREGYWSVLDAMRTRPDRFELLSNNRSLFCIGREHARFDVQMNKLMEPLPLLQGGDFTAMIAADNIYLLDETVERYSIPNNKWTTVKATPFAHRGGAGAVLTGSFYFNKTMETECYAGISRHSTNFKSDFLAREPKLDLRAWEPNSHSSSVKLDESLPTTFSRRDHRCVLAGSL